MTLTVTTIRRRPGEQSIQVPRPKNLRKNFPRLSTFFLSVYNLSVSWFFIFFLEYFSSLYPGLFHLVFSNFFPQAYKKLVEKEGTDGALPGLGLTEEQLFFVGFARVGIIEKINPHKHFF